jgi:hypothetical protein
MVRHITADSGSIFDQTSDLRKIYEIGDQLHVANKGTDGSITIWLFLDFTHKRIGESGIGATMLGNLGAGDAQLLALDTVDEPSQRVSIRNCMIYAVDAFPSLSDHGDTVADRINALESMQQTTTGKKVKFPASLNTTEAVPPPPPATPAMPPTAPTPAAATPALPTSMPATLSEFTDMLKQHTDSMKAFQRTQMESQAHLGHLMRTQYDNLAPPSKSHVHARANADPTKTAIFAADAAHTDEQKRKNLGVRYNRNDRTKRTGMRYQDKPAAQWQDIDDELKTHLSSALGIKDNDDWTRMGPNPCDLCTVKDHWLNRCLKVFAATNQGRKFFGADKAAQRVRTALGNKLSYLDVLTLYHMCDTDDNDAVQSGLCDVMQQSDVLCAINDETMVVTDTAAIAEFDLARAKVLAVMGDTAHLS